METELPESEGQSTSPAEEQANQPSINSYGETAFSPVSQPDPAFSTGQGFPQPQVVACPHCQQEHPQGTVYCPQTGKPLKVETPPEATQPAQSSIPQTLPYPPPQPQYPGGSQQPYYPQPYPSYYAPRPPKDRSIALILEILPGLFGFLGFGWIFSGNTNTGIAWLIGFLVWDVMAIIIVALTAGFGALCTLPISLVLIVVSATNLNNYARQNPQIFGVIA
jgi:hypothetical protein